MNLTPEQQALGRRNFLKALAGAPALAGLGVAAAVRGPLRGGPVRIGFVGVGGQGGVLLEQLDPAYGEVRAVCDVNPAHLARAAATLSKTSRPPARQYAEWRDMLQKEDLEAVIVAAPLWMHAEIATGCLEAGRHVLCEKMMAWDIEGAERMRDAAARSHRILEIGYQRFYNPMYRAAYEGVVRQGVLGDVYHARLAWHRNGNWRRSGTPPSPDYDPSRWGYPTFEHLLNWRLYWRYSKGLFAELGSHLISATNWFFGAAPESVAASGGVQRFRDGREVYDHVYAIFDYPQGRTAVLSSIESNAFDDYYEMFMGTKGTLILKGESEAYLFHEGREGGPTTVDVTIKGPGPVLEASESRRADAAGTAGGRASTSDTMDRLSPYRLEMAGFCSAIRAGTPLACGPEKALASTRACVRANEAVAQKTRLAI